VVALAYLAGKLAYRLRDVILLIAVAGFIALILNPLVVYVQRRIPRRGWAVAIVTVWAAVVFTGLLLAFGYPLVNGLTHLAHRLPSYVQSAAHGRSWIGHLARRLHLTAWAARNAPKLQSLGTSLARPALSFGKGAASLLATLATLATITALVLLLLLEGPKMRRGLLGLMSQDRAAARSAACRRRRKPRARRLVVAFGGDRQVPRRVQLLLLGCGGPYYRPPGLHR